MNRDLRLALTALGCGAVSLAVAVWVWVHFDFWAGLACFACSLLGAKGSDAMVEYGRRQDLPPRP